MVFAPKSRNSRSVMASRTDSERTAPAAGKNGAGPRACTITPDSATEAGNAPRLASITRLITPADQMDRRPALEQGNDDDVAEATGRAEDQGRRRGSRQAAEAGHERDRDATDQETRAAPSAGPRRPSLAAVTVPATDPAPKHAIRAGSQIPDDLHRRLAG